jgi:hypothetical protein
MSMARHPFAIRACGMAALMAIALAAPPRANAYFFDVNAFYLSDSSSVSSASSASSKLTYGLTLGVNIDKKGAWLVGWNYEALSLSDTASSSTTTYATTQMGPKFYVFFDKDRSWFLSAAYNISTKATYASGAASSQDWTGTAIAASFGYQGEVGSGAYMGLRLNYNAGSYSESAVGGTYSTISNSRTVIYPSVGLMIAW